MSNDWHTDHRNLHRLCEYLDSEGCTTAEILRVIEKPWKWTGEFQELELTNKIKSICDPMGLDDVELPTPEEQAATTARLDRSMAQLQEIGARLDMIRPDRFEPQ